MLYSNDDGFTYHYDSEGQRIESPEPQATDYGRLDDIVRSVLLARLRAD
jgi:hypothetical protein